jgi:Ca2+-binding RTX toxin-like protein
MADITGTAKSDIINGTQLDDIIYGLAGNDKIFGNDGVDNILGGNGNDYIEGGFGDDYLQGEDGNDKIYGGNGLDFLRGGLGNDFLDPGDGKSSISGGAGNDTMVFHQDQPIELSGTSYQGEAGNDTLIFSDNTYVQVIGLPLTNQTIPGYPTSFFFANAAYVEGVEVFDASLASQLVYTGQDLSPVTVIGTANNDALYGRGANETLIGGAGNDAFDPGGGSDVMISQENDSDNFHFQWDTNFGNDIIAPGQKPRHGSERNYLWRPTLPSHCLSAMCPMPTNSSRVLQEARIT